jgi:hypothetical protein
VCNSAKTQFGPKVYSNFIQDDSIEGDGQVASGSESPPDPVALDRGAEARKRAE